MKNLKLIFVVVTLSLAFVACSEKKVTNDSVTETSSEENTLQGKWKVVKAEANRAESYIGMNWEFKNDTMVFDRSPCLYKTSNDTIYAASAFAATKYTYQFQKNQLILVLIGYDQTFYLERN